MGVVKFVCEISHLQKFIITQPYVSPLHRQQAERKAQYIGAVFVYAL